VNTYEIDGDRFSTLEEFYEEIGRILIPGLSWGHNLNALRDILSWVEEEEPPDNEFVLRWKNHDLSRQRLGYPYTVRQLEKSLDATVRHNARGGPIDLSVNLPLIQLELDRARAGEGPTVFDWIVEVLNSSGYVHLELA
jgi:RNAse (barnase) inhibitor barstar